MKKDGKSAGKWVNAYMSNEDLRAMLDELEINAMMVGKLLSLMKTKEMPHGHLQFWLAKMKSDNLVAIDVDAKYQVKDFIIITDKGRKVVKRGKASLHARPCSDEDVSYQTTLKTKSLSEAEPSE